MSAMIDLSTVAAPAVVEPLDFEAVLAQLKAKLLEHLPELASVLELESEPLVKLMQLMAYREVLLRQRINEAARALLLAYAVGTDLEQLGANYGITRLPGETDERLRARVQAAYNRLAAAGPAQAYRQHALAVSADIRDVDVFSEAPGRVTVSVLACQLVPETEATAADAAAGLALFGPSGVPGQVLTVQPNSGPLLLQVLATLNAEDVRPLTDHVVVRAPRIIPYTVQAVLEVRPGPDPAQVLARRRAELTAYTRARQVQGEDATLAGIVAALMEPAVRDVRLAAPLDTVAAERGEIAVCIGTTITAEVLHA